MRILSYSAKFSASWLLLPGYNISATMATICSTYHLRAVASLKFVGIENMPAHFAAHVFGQMAGWIRIPLSMEVCLVPCDIVLDGDPPPHGKWHSSPRLSGPLLWPTGSHFTHDPFCRLGSA